MLQLQNITFTVPASDSGTEPPSGQTIINDVSFAFEQGRFYAITGPNGSGKTTIAKLIMGINELTSGKI
ncbi:MAG: ATP-binding cassette domain-containing protein, partial [Desulfotignum sp.]